MMDVRMYIWNFSPFYKTLSKGSEGQLECFKGQLVGLEGLPEGLEGLPEGSDGLPEGP